jgi:hypothetical protein
MLPKLLILKGKIIPSAFEGIAKYRFTLIAIGGIIII